MNFKLVLIIALFVVAVAAALGFAMSEGGMEYRTFPELKGDAYGGERVLVKAQVVTIENKYKPTIFSAVDIPPEQTEGAVKGDRPRGSCRVIYEGPELPEGFKEGCHTTLEGRYDPKREAFVAVKMTTQCPSKYEGAGVPPPPQAAGSPEVAKP
jgi:hypothetical protein